MSRGFNSAELLTKTAKLADKLAIVRCMTQPLPGIGNSHPLGSQYIFSGEAPGGPVEMPDMASSVNYKLGAKAKYLPAAILLPGTDERRAAPLSDFCRRDIPFSRPAGTWLIPTGSSEHRTYGRHRRAAV